MSNMVIEVPPLSTACISKETGIIRNLLQLDKVKKFPILRIIEHILPKLYDFHYEIIPENEFTSFEGKYFPESNVMLIREDVYNKAYDNDGRSRFTLAHEFGHFILHKKENISFSRNLSPVPAFRDPEWQANTFASLLLMPKYLIQNLSAMEIAKDFYVSQKAANIRLDILKKHKL